MSIKLTFVVPCFNAERYLQQCLDSIFSCGLGENHYEVLCVDDGSTDGTSEILKSNCETHDNLRIVTHEINKGWGGPRNTGIIEAKGQYLWYVDADDRIRKEGLEKAVEKAVDEKLDVLGFNYERVNDEGEVLSKQMVFEDITTRDGYSFAKVAFNGGIVNHMGFVWRFLYRTEYLRAHQLFFPEQVCWEDTVFMPKSILEAERVSAISDVLYSYRVNAGSVSGVFARVYPANLIYDFAFHAGPDLLHFSNEVKDKDLASSFSDSAIHKYINGFAIHLLRTGKQERKRFYKMIKDRSAEVVPLKQYMSVQNKVMLMPGVGPLITELMSCAYKLKHGKRG